MTEAGWTREKPTVAGWYWMRAPKYGWRDCDCPSDPIIVRVVHDGYGLIVYGLEEYSRQLYETRGEWLGPLSPDSYQQGRVAGLREAAEMVEDDCYIEGGELLPDYEHRCKHNVNQKELAGKIRFRANDLAQQAQKEKGVGDDSVQ